MRNHSVNAAKGPSDSYLADNPRCSETRESIVKFVPRSYERISYRCHWNIRMRQLASWSVVPQRSSTVKGKWSEGVLDLLSILREQDVVDGDSRLG